MNLKLAFKCKPQLARCTGPSYNEICTLGWKWSHILSKYGLNMSCAQSGAVLTHLVLTIPAPGGSESGCGGAQSADTALM